MPVTDFSTATGIFIFSVMTQEFPLSIPQSLTKLNLNNTIIKVKITTIR